MGFEGFHMNIDERPFEDLVEFYRHWPDLREQVIALAKEDTVSNELAEVLRSMILIVDRVGPDDFA